MKKILIGVLLLLPILSVAQTAKDIFNPDVPLVFFGADFTKVQFTKSGEFTNKPEILRFFDDINNLLKRRDYRHLIGRKMNRDTLTMDFSYVNRNNALVNWESVYSDNVDYTLSDDVIRQMIRDLKVDQALYKDHIGFVFCQENYCKTKPKGSDLAVFFRINDLEPLFIKRYSTEPMGIGFLNYWGFQTVYTIALLNKIEKELIRIK
jgi:hypothetical protein